VTVASAVFDASAIMRAVVGNSAAAVEALGEADRKLAPDLVLSESTNTLVKYCRGGLLARADAAALLGEILALPLEIRSSRSLLPAALTISLERGITAYDACYVALAEAAHAPLVTADRRLAAAYERSELIA
jgi:predicted nucleic acid-binding protein